MDDSWWHERRKAPEADKAPDSVAPNLDESIQDELDNVPLPSGALNTVAHDMARRSLERAMGNLEPSRSGAADPSAAQRTKSDIETIRTQAAWLAAAETEAKRTSLAATESRGSVLLTAVDDDAGEDDNAEGEDDEAPATQKRLDKAIEGDSAAAAGTTEVGDARAGAEEEPDMWPDAGFDLPPPAGGAKYKQVCMLLSLAVVAAGVAWKVHTDGVAAQVAAHEAELLRAQEAAEEAARQQALAHSEAPARLVVVGSTTSALLFVALKMLGLESAFGLAGWRGGGDVAAAARGWRRQGETPRLRREGTVYPEVTD